MKEKRKSLKNACNEKIETPILLSLSVEIEVRCSFLSVCVDQSLWIAYIYIQARGDEERVCFVV